jgi:hypothetical protein
MSASDAAQRVCTQIALPEKGLTLGAARLRRWRANETNRNVDRTRSFIQRYIQQLEPVFDYPRAVLMRGLQRVIGDPACGPDRREFGHCLAPALYDEVCYGYIVYAFEDERVYIDKSGQSYRKAANYALAYSQYPLPAPPGTIELSPKSTQFALVQQFSPGRYAPPDRPSSRRLLHNSIVLFGNGRLGPLAIHLVVGGPAVRLNKDYSPSPYRYRAERLWLRIIANKLPGKRSGS